MYQNIYLNFSTAIVSANQKPQIIFNEENVGQEEFAQRGVEQNQRDIVSFSSFSLEKVTGARPLF